MSGLVVAILKTVQNGKSSRHIVFRFTNSKKSIRAFFESFQAFIFIFALKNEPYQWIILGYLNKV